MIDTNFIASIQLFRETRDRIRSAGWAYVAHFFVPMFVVGLSITQVSALVPGDNLFGTLSVYKTAVLDGGITASEGGATVLLVERNAQDLIVRWKSDLHGVKLSDQEFAEAITISRDTLHIKARAAPIGSSLAIIADAYPYDTIDYRGEVYAVNELTNLTGTPARIVIWCFIAAVFGFGLFMSGPNGRKDELD